MDIMVKWKIVKIFYYRNVRFDVILPILQAYLFYFLWDEGQFYL